MDNGNAAEHLFKGKQPLLLLKKVIDESPVPTWISDASGLMIYGNQCLFNTLKVEAKDLLGSYNVLNDQNLADQGFLPLVQSVFDKKEHVHFEMIWNPEKVDKNLFIQSRKMFINVQLYPLTDSDGTLHHVVCQWFDITEQRERETRLKTREAELASYISNAPYGVFIADENGRYLKVNPKASEITGYSENELLQLGVPDLLPEDQIAKGVKHFQSLKRDIASSIELKFIHKSGEQKYWYVSAVKLDEKHYMGFVDDITDRKIAEEQLRRSDEKLKLAMTSAEEGIWEYDLSSGQVDFDDVALGMLGYSREDLGGVSNTADWGFSNVHPDDLPEMMELFQRFIERKVESYKTEFRLLHKDGHYIWVMSTGHILTKNKDGSPEIVIGMHREITERKKREEALRSSEFRYRNLVETASDGIYLISDKGELLEINNGAVEMLGYSKGELRNKMIYDIDPNFTVETFLEFWNEVPLGKIMIFKTDHKKKDGSYLPVEVCGKKYENNNKVYFYGIARDMSERQNTEIELERRLEAMKTSMDGMALLSSSEKYIFLNKAHANIYGYDSPDELIGCTWRILYEEEELKRFETDIMPQLFKDGFYRGEATGKKKDGSLFPQELSLNTLEDGGLACVVRDITDRKNAEMEQKNLREQLVQSQKLESVGRLAGGVAHDFNNMLNVILGHTDMLISDLSQDDETIQTTDILSSLEEIHSAASRSADLTRRLLGFARKQTVIPVLLDINQIIEGMLKMLSRLIGENIDLNWIPLNEIDIIRMDPGQIDQILTNLVVNSRDAIAGNGTITIKTARASFDNAFCKDHPTFLPGRFVVLTVTDTGKGIPESELRHVFEPFYTTKEVGKGTGLGLATVYGIMKQNKGFIQLKSQLGKGTTAEVYFPVHGSEKQENESQKSSKVELITGTETILLVEDEVAILKLGEQILNRLGYNVLSAATPLEALEIAHNHPGDIHMLITDVVMPEMNGRDLASKLMKIYPTIKRLFMSGYTANVIAPHGILDEGVPFLQKPFTVKDLSDAIRDAMSST